MESEDYLGIMLVGVLSLGSYFGVYKLGRYLERRDLTKALIESVDQTCNDCYIEGEKAGYKRGNKVGLGTCDDLLSNFDDGGHR